MWVCCKVMATRLPNYTGLYEIGENFPCITNAFFEFSPYESQNVTLSKFEDISLT